MSIAEKLGRHRHKVLPVLLLIAGVVLTLVYRSELSEWFAGASRDTSVGAAGAPGSSGAATSANRAGAVDNAGTYRFDDAARLRLREAFAAYEGVREQLAHDSVEHAGHYAQAVEQALAAATAAASQAPAAVVTTLTQAGKEAAKLATVNDVKLVRQQFGELSRQLVTLIESDPELAQGLFLFKCPMAEGFQKWFQPAQKLENPYMGQSMLECGEPVQWSKPASEQAQPVGATASAGEIAYYTCSMHPSVKQAGPGNCPICGMTLTPVTKAELETGTIVVDEGRRQRIGVKIASVMRQPMTLKIRAVGAVKYDETRLSDVNLRMSGWVQRLIVNQTGQRVARGQTLFTLYSPELYATQLEHLAASKRQGEGAGETLVGLARASRQRLRLLGMSDAQVSELETRGEPWEHVPIAAPAGGVVIEKNVVEGARVDAGMLVYRIADLTRVWVDADVYEGDLPHVKLGQTASVDLPYAPGKVFEGKVDFIYPELQAQTRTGRVRVVLKNAELELKLDMYANVKLDVDLGERLTVPESAIVYTGPRRLVFVDLGEGKLQPKAVELGVKAGDVYEVVSGLAEGDRVVTSGNFLIAAESRIRSAAGYWGEQHDPP